MIDTLNELNAKSQSPTPGGDFCLNIECLGGGAQWMQLLTGVINFHYPREVQPTQFLAEACGEQTSDWTTMSWQSGKFATFEFPVVKTAELVSILTNLWRSLYAMDLHSAELKLELMNLE